MLLEFFAQFSDFLIEFGGTFFAEGSSGVGARRGEFQRFASQRSDQRDVTPLEEVGGRQHLGVEASGSLGLECDAGEAFDAFAAEEHGGRSIDRFGSEFTGFEGGGKSDAGTGFADSFDVDIVREYRECAFDHAISNSFAFGGSNVSVVISKC